MFFDTLDSHFNNCSLLLVYLFFNVTHVGSIKEVIFRILLLLILLENDQLAPINVGVRTSLHAPQLISRARALKLTTM
jgi:hypothetical protein